MKIMQWNLIQKELKMKNLINVILQKAFKKSMIQKVSLVATVLLSSGMSYATVCNKTINNNAVGSLTVPSGATCTLNGTSVDGNVSVQKNGTFILNNSSVSGSVQADTAKAIKLINSSVEGDVKATQVATSLSLDKSMISGNLYCSSLVKLSANMSSIEGKTIGKCK